MRAWSGAAVSGVALTGHDPAGHGVAGPRGSTAWAVGSVALAVSLIGTIGAAAEIGADAVSPIAVGAWRGVIGAVGLLVVSTLRGQAPWRYPLPVRWVALGGLGVATSQLLFFEGMARTGVAVGTLVSIGVGPLVAGVIDWLAYRRRPDRRWLTGMAVALAGVALLSGGGAEVVWSGVVIAALAGCGIPCMGFAIQQLVTDRPLVTTVATTFSAGAVVLVPTALGAADTVFSSVGSTSTVLYLGLVTVTLAHSLWAAGLKRLSLSVVVVVGLLEPAVAATLGITVLSEPVTVGLIAGICLVIAGVAVTSLGPAARRAH